MSKNWKFIKENNTMFEKVFGREHHWYCHPEIVKNAGSYLVKVVMPEGGEHNFHRHPKMHEILYILKGKAEQWIEDEMQILEVGDSVYIDADVVHATFNAGKDELEFLAVLSPLEGWDAGTLDVSLEEPYVNYRSE